MKKAKDLNQVIVTKIKPDSILFFDLDGTLVDTDFANNLSYEKAIKSVINSNSIIGFDLSERFNRTLLKKTIPNLSEIEIIKIVKLKELNYKEYLSQTKLKKVFVEILLQYSKTNKCALVTNCRENRAIITLNYHGLTDKFSHFFFRQFSDENKKKSKFQHAILSLDISPKSVLVFENEESEIEDAIEAGILVENIINGFKYE